MAAKTKKRTVPSSPDAIAWWRCPKRHTFAATYNQIEAGKNCTQCEAEKPLVKAQALKAARVIWAAEYDWHDPKELSARWHIHPGPSSGTDQERAAWFAKNGDGRCIIIAGMSTEGDGQTWAAALEDFKRRHRKKTRGTT